MKRVEVLFLEGCPNRNGTVEALRGVARDLNVAVDFVEIEVSTAEEAERLGFLGSPTVRVDGVDVEPATRSSATYGLACRTYDRAGIPPREMLVSALADGRGATSERRGTVASVFGAGALLLPVGTCPACFPPYAAALSSVGLGFLVYERYLLPITALVLGASLAGLAWRAEARRGYGPFVVGLGGAVTALVGKFGAASNPLLYGGLAALVISSVWNAWPRRHATPGSCEGRAPRGEMVDDRAHPSGAVS